NLLLSHRPEEVRPLLNLSLATFQQHPSDSRSLEAVKRITSRLQKLMTGGSCGGPEQGLLLFQRARELKTEASRLTKARPRIVYQGLLQNALSPGRLFERKGGQIYCVIRPHERQGRTGVLAVKVRKDRLLKKGRLRMKWVPFERVGLVLATQLDLPLDSSSEALVRQITAAAVQEHIPLNLDRLDLEQDQGPLARHEMRLAALKDEKKRLACQTCPLSENCVNNKDSQVFKLLARLEKLQAQTGGSSRLLWSSFMRRLEFLRDEGFVAPDDELTEDGKWAAKLRLDHPLIIAAGIRARAWPEDDPALLAALISPFVLDNDKPAEPLGPTRTIPSTLTPAWLHLEKAVRPLMQHQQGRGFETPALNPRASLAIYSWATLGDWNDAVRVLGQDEGDLAMLAFRTADSLRQLASLADTQPGLAASARHAIDLILKEPVTVPL
ncbi:MAG: hypothetical protein JRI54_15105, partial [Deltaproteobacteria bacterium]|nr:hypothetical protein [Deltaproteobacteria bacterium]